jgi:hypothetical protein
VADDKFAVKLDANERTRLGDLISKGEVAAETILKARIRAMTTKYERNGTANLFMLFAPLAGFRHVEVTERRMAIDYARILKDLSDVHFPKAEKIVLVQDNLNTLVPVSLYEAFEPAVARR